MEILMHIIEVQFENTAIVESLLLIILSEPSSTYIWLDRHLKSLFSNHLRDDITSPLIKISMNTNSSDAAKLHALQLLSTYISSLESAVPYQNDHTLLCTLILNLSSENEFLRNGSLDVLSTLGENSPHDSVEYSVGASIKLNYKEFSMSGTFTSSWLSSFLEGSNGAALTKIFTTILSNNESFSFDSYLLVKVLCEIKEPPASLAPHLTWLLSNTVTLSLSQGNSLQLLLAKFLPTLPPSAAYKTVIAAINSPDINNFSPKILALKSVNENFWNCLKSNQKVIKKKLQ